MFFDWSLRTPCHILGCWCLVLRSNTVCDAGRCISIWGPWWPKELPQDNHCEYTNSLRLRCSGTTISLATNLDNDKELVGVFHRGYSVFNTQFQTTFEFQWNADICCPAYLSEILSRYFSSNNSACWLQVAWAFNSFLYSTFASCRE